jgi:hypothetical protein
MRINVYEGKQNLYISFSLAVFIYKKKTFNVVGTDSLVPETSVAGPIDFCAAPAPVCQKFRPPAPSLAPAPTLSQIFLTKKINIFQF